MTNKQIIKQLEALIDNREAFYISDPEHDESYVKDIEALKAAIKVLKNAAPMKHGRWISISEKMPPDLQDVIVSDGNFIATGYFMNLMKMWHIYGNSIPQHKEAYSYWQPLPEPPERNDNT